MKSIELKAAKETPVINGRSTEVELKTIDLIKIAINQAPEGGYTPAEMQQRVRAVEAIDALAEDATELSLEDADYENVKKWVKAVKWAFISKFILAFTNQF